MPSTDDFISLAYSDDLTWAGIKHTCRSLAYPNWEKKQLRLEQLLQHIAEKGVELALLRQLQVQEIPYQIKRRSPFTLPDDHYIHLGDRLCLVKAHLLLMGSSQDKYQFSHERLCRSNALVPSASIDTEDLRSTDLVILAFVLAWKPGAGGEDKGFYIYRMPSTWSAIKPGSPIRQIAVRNDSDRTVTLEIVGTTGRSMQYHSVAASIDPREQSTIDTELTSLAFLQCGHRPEGRIYIYHPDRNLTQYVYPRQWWDIWLNGNEIIIPGYTTIAELRNSIPTQPDRKAITTAPFKKNQPISYPIAQLHALGELFRQVASWGKTSRVG